MTFEERSLLFEEFEGFFEENIVIVTMSNKLIDKHFDLLKKISDLEEMNEYERLISMLFISSLDYIIIITSSEQPNIEIDEND